MELPGTSCSFYIKVQMTTSVYHLKITWYNFSTVQGQHKLILNWLRWQPVCSWRVMNNCACRFNSLTSFTSTSVTILYILIKTPTNTNTTKKRRMLMPWIFVRLEWRLMSCPKLCALARARPGLTWCILHERRIHTHSCMTNAHIRTVQWQL